MSFEGTDAKSGAFSTAGQVKKLNSFSLVSLYFVAKEQFGNLVSWEGPKRTAAFLQHKQRPSVEHQHLLTCAAI
jgi:hypothetical protein